MPKILIDLWWDGCDDGNNSGLPAFIEDALESTAMSCKVLKVYRKGDSPEDLLIDIHSTLTGSTNLARIKDAVGMIETFKENNVYINIPDGDWRG